MKATRQGLKITAISIGGAIILALFFTAPVYAKEVTVHMKDMKFSPKDITVDTGDTIQWINDDFVIHSATVKGGWDVTIPAHAQRQLTIDKPGTYNYYCRIHPTMKGTVRALKH